MRRCRLRSRRAAACFVGAGEGSLLIAEELGFHQIFRDRAAVDLQKRLILSGAVIDDQFRHQFLAGPGFPQDQHGSSVERGDPLGELDHLAKGLAMGDNRTLVQNGCRRGKDRQLCKVVIAHFGNPLLLPDSVKNRGLRKHPFIQKVLRGRTHGGRGAAQCGADRPGVDRDDAGAGASGAGVEGPKGSKVTHIFSA